MLIWVCLKGNYTCFVYSIICNTACLIGLVACFTITFIKLITGLATFTLSRQEAPVLACLLPIAGPFTLSTLPGERKRLVY